MAVGETATDTFTYTVDDGNGGTSTATVTITITGQNDAPVANAVSGGADEDGPVATVSADFSDIDASDTHTFSVNDSETAGIVTNNEDGTFSYDPNGQFESLAVGETASDTFTYTVDDGNGGTSTATVTITITGQNDAPIANAVSGSANEDGPVATVSADFSDVDASDTHTFSVDDSGTTGVVTNNEDGTFSYDPNGQFESLAVGETASDTFTYTVDDGNGGTSTATVTITINGQNDDPIANAVSGSVNEDGPVATVSADFSDVDASDTHTFSVDDSETVGIVTDNGDGSFDYDPNGQFESLAVGETASDTFTYTVTDNNGGTSTATVTITITGQNDDPVALDDSASTDEDVAVTVAVLNNDSTVDTNNSLTVQSVTQGLNGVVSFTDTDVTYTPNEDFNGTDSFTYTITDGDGGTATATVTIDVNSVNDAPETGADSFSVAEDTNLIVPVSASILNNDSDSHDGAPGEDNTPLTVVANSDPANGSVIVNEDGSFTYQPAADFNGTDSFTYTVSDSLGATSVETVTITVTAVSDALADAISTPEDSSGSVNVFANDNFEDPTAAVTSVTQGTQGSVTFLADGTVTYTPNADTNGTDSFSYTVTAGGAEETQTVNVTISPVNGTPEFAVGGDIAVDEDSGSFAATQVTDIDDGDSEVVQSLTFNVSNDIVVVGDIECE